MPISIEDECKMTFLTQEGYIKKTPHGWTVFSEILKVTGITDFEKVSKAVKETLYPTPPAGSQIKGSPEFEMFQLDQYILAPLLRHHTVEDLAQAFTAKLLNDKGLKDNLAKYCGEEYKESLDKLARLSLQDLGLYRGMENI